MQPYAHLRHPAEPLTDTAVGQRPTDLLDRVAPIVSYAGQEQPCASYGEPFSNNAQTAPKQHRNSAPQRNPCAVHLRNESQSTPSNFDVCPQILLILLTCVLKSTVGVLTCVLKSGVLMCVLVCDSDPWGARFVGGMSHRLGQELGLQRGYAFPTPQSHRCCSRPNPAGPLPTVRSAHDPNAPYATVQLLRRRIALQPSKLPLLCAAIDQRERTDLWQLQQIAFH